MTIGKRLYLSFGAVLAMVIVLFLVNIVAVQREHAAKAAGSRALELSQATNRIRFQMMENRLNLTNYLLSGDTREKEAIEKGIRDLNGKLVNTESIANSDQQRVALAQVQQSELSWVKNFSEPMIAKRGEVDAGNATVAELQIFYLQKDASSYMKTTDEFLDQADQENQKFLEERRQSDETAGQATITVALLSTLIALALGVAIAFTTEKSITEPLSNLMMVAQQIGETGDLEHQIDVKRNDEIGGLARTFSGMVTYLKEMAGVSEAIAEGNLAVTAEPRSINDTLGNAFARMTIGLRTLVRNGRDAALQVAGAANEVAGASDESAKISHR